MADELERAYIQGFYTALKGARFCAQGANTPQDVINDIDATLEVMRADGDLDHVNTGVDELIDIVAEAERLGVADSVLDAIEEEIRRKGSK